MSKKRDQRKRAEKAERATDQQRQNREAKNKKAAAEKLKPKKGEFPQKHVMDAIADSLHEAVTSAFEDLERTGVDMQPLTPTAKMQGRCMYYAAAGRIIATVILGREYFIQVGSLGVMTDNERMIKIDAANGGIAARRFHMWLGADEGGFVEYVDFTSRFFKEWAGQAGVKWERDDLPPYLWGKQKDIRELHGVHYQIEESEEPEADKMIEAAEPLIDQIVERAILIARKRLLV